MSTTITTAQVQQYRRNVQIKYQQEGSVLRPFVRMEDTNARYHYFDLLAPTAAIKNVGRHADTPLVNSQHERRRAEMDDYDWADLIDNQDRVRILIDPQGAYVMNAVMALGRSIDQIIVDSFDSAASEGESGATSVAFPAAQVVNSGGAGAFSVDFMRQTKRKFDDADVPMTDRHMALAPSALEDLLNETEVTSSDFNTVKALVQGDLNTFLGFQIHMVTPDIMPISGTTREAFAWHRRAMGLAMGMDISVDVGPRRDKRNSLQVYVSAVFGAVRIEDEGVVRIEYTE